MNARDSVATVYEPAEASARFTVRVLPGETVTVAAPVRPPGAVAATVYEPAGTSANAYPPLPLVVVDRAPGLRVTVAPAIGADVVALVTVPWMAPAAGGGPPGGVKVIAVPLRSTGWFS